MNILQTKEKNNIIANTTDGENSPYPIVFRNLSENYNQESMKYGSARNFHQILFILDGEGEVICGSSSYPLSRGCAFFTQAYVPVEYANRGGLVSAFLTVTGEAVDTLARSLSGDGFLYFDNVNLEKYLLMLRNIKHECETDMNQGRLSALSYSFFVEFLSQRKSGAPEYLESAVKYIEGNLSAKLTLEDIARQSCVSVSKLSHGFKKTYGISVFEYVLEIRLRYARNLILSPGRIMTKDAALASGFSDVGYFCRAYKERFGVTPGGDGK